MWWPMIILENQSNDNFLYARLWRDSLVKIGHDGYDVCRLMNNFKQSQKTPFFFYLFNMIESDIFGGHLLARKFQHEECNKE